MFVAERVVRPCDTVRSELELDPTIRPVTVMPDEPPLRVRTVPFFVSVPESVRRPLPAFWIVSEPLPRAKMFLPSVPETPAYWRMPDDVEATPRFTVAFVPSDWIAVARPTVEIASVPFWTFVVPE